MKNKKITNQMPRIKRSLRLRLILSFFLMANFAILNAQNTISGTITDSKTTEQLQ